MAFAPASSVSLSQEILDEIVDAVAILDAKDLSSVKACSLAARAFLPRSQYHIFAHITLSLSDHGAEEDASTCPRSDAERFINNALQSTPKLALLVRSVTLTNHNSDLDHSNGSLEKWRSDDLEYLIPSDPHLAPLFSRLRNMHTLKIDGLDLGFVDDHPFGGDASAAQVLASFSAFFRDKLITTLVLHEVGFSARKLLTELLKGFQHTRTLDFTAVFRTTMFSLEAIPTTGIPLVPDDTEDDAPIPLRNLIIGLSEVSDTELRGVLRNPYPLSLSELELLEFRDRTIHDRTYFEDIEQALEMTRSSLKTAVFNFYWIETNSPQFLSFQHLTDVRIKIHYCHPSDSVLRNEAPMFAANGTLLATSGGSG
ncbi:hypothetical protein BDZ89DRAFT_1169226 [Hymenopellis radicata]|nr:hypothetical protein BDZ89DRAFT_1169226 [Hymenopellis radicata]